MKKLLMALFLILSVNAYADSIPGFLELDINLQKWNGATEMQSSYYNTEIDFKYGGTFKWFKPYMFLNTQTFFITGSELDTNYPFRDQYTLGFGFMINDVLYIEAGHTCTHYVKSRTEDTRLYESMTKLRHNHIKIGLKFNID